MNREVNKILKRLFRGKGISWCESCGVTSNLTFAHRKKRRHYQSIQALTDWNEVILLCMEEHQKIEKDPNATVEMFNKLRIQDET